MTVTALQGESLDALVWRATGRGDGAVELVLAANPGLADLAAALPEGTPVAIPPLPTAITRLDTVNLWD